MESPWPRPGRIIQSDGPTRGALRALAARPDLRLAAVGPSSASCNRDLKPDNVMAEYQKTKHAHHLVCRDYPMCSSFGPPSSTARRADPRDRARTRSRRPCAVLPWRPSRMPRATEVGPRTATLRRFGSLRFGSLSHVQQPSTTACFRPRDCCAVTSTHPPRPITDAPTSVRAPPSRQSQPRLHRCRKAPGQTADARWSFRPPSSARLIRWRV